jgi:predicted ester cyclase
MWSGLLLFSCAARGKERIMSIQRDKQTVRRFIEEVINQGRMEVADELFDPSYGPEGAAVRGPDRGRHGAQLFRQGFPDVRFRIDDLIAEGDLVMVHVFFEGTHLGPFLGVPPTGRSVRATGVELARLHEGKVIEERWHLYDELGILRQLGAVRRLEAGEQA